MPWKRGAANSPYVIESAHQKNNKPSEHFYVENLRKPPTADYGSNKYDVGDGHAMHPESVQKR